MPRLKLASEKELRMKDKRQPPFQPTDKRVGDYVLTSRGLVLIKERGR